MHFWRLAFFPAYDPEAVSEALKTLLGKLGIGSYAARETLGTMDVILRAWLPERIPATEFEEALREELEGVNLNIADRFDVSRVVYHWSWSAGAPRHPQNLELLEIAAKEGLFQGEPGATSNEFIVDLEREGLLTRTAPEQGNTFVMSIDGRLRGLSGDTRRELSSMLTSTVTSSPKIAEQTLYEGTGFASYLLLARIEAHELDAVGQLSAEILRLTPDSGFQVTTTTMVTHPQEVMIYREELPPKRAPRQPESTVKAALLRGADAVTEIREAVFALPEDGEDAESARFDQAVSFLRGVVSFLNGEGGQVMIGARLIGEDEGEHGGRHSVGDYYCTGIARELEDCGWDEYRKRLESLVDRHIKPSPLRWITIERENVGDREMALIRVEEPAGGGWFYLTGDGPGSAERFFVRRGETTIELDLPDADAYRRIGASPKHLGANDWAIVRALQRQPRLDRYQLARTAGISAAESDRALDRLIAARRVLQRVGDDEVTRYVAADAPREPTPDNSEPATA